MSQENVELVRWLMAYEPGTDDDAFLEVIDPDVEWDMTHRSFDPRVYRGHEGVRAWNDGLAETWAQWRSEPVEFIDAGDQVLVMVLARGRGRASGVEVVEESASLFTLREGRVTRLKIYLDREQARRDAGLAD